MFGFGFVVWVYSFLLRDWLVFWYCSMNVELQSPCPKDQEQLNPSMRNPGSTEMISDSVELCETAVCFLHIQLIGTNVLLSKTHKTHPEVDFESSRSPAKSGSSNKPNLQCCAVFPHDNIVGGN